MARSTVPQQVNRISEILRAAIVVGLIAGGAVGFVVFTQGRDSFHFTVAVSIVLAAVCVGSGLGALLATVLSALPGGSGDE